MRRAFIMAAIALVALGNAGCFIPIYPSDPNERVDALLVSSENLRQIKDEWARFWFTDQPSHMTYDRIHGGIE
jgi:hypothetical protein